MKKDYKYLKNINFPSDIKKLSEDQLERIIRRSKTRNDRCCF